jgi:TolA-binding protein
LSSRAIAANDAIRVGVARFGSKAEGITDEQAAIISDFFSFELTKAKSLAVCARDSIDKIGGELKFDMSGIVDPLTAAEIGKTEGLRYMLLGSVTHVDQHVGGGVILSFVALEMKAAVDVRIVEVSTAEVKKVLRSEGNSRNQTAGMDWKGFIFMRHKIGNIQAMAVADAVAKLSDDVRNALESELILGKNDGPIITPNANHSKSAYIPPRGGEPSDDAAGVDPDNKTDAKLIDTYPLSSRDRNMLGIQQRNAFRLYSKRKYKDALAAFSALAEQYDCNYLSAYWAGMAALKAKDNAKAAEFFDLALSRNPNYQPALREKEKLDKARKK